MWVVTAATLSQASKTTATFLLYSQPNQVLCVSKIDSSASAIAKYVHVCYGAPRLQISSATAVARALSP